MANEVYEKRREQMFPRLTPQQISRIEPHCQRVATSVGDVLGEPGDPDRKLIVVLSGSVELWVPGPGGLEMLTVLVTGDFAGEMSTLRGIAGFARVSVREAGDVLTMDGEHLRAVVQTDAELSEILMRAFILRRMGLISSNNGEVMLLGSRHSANTLQLREFLTRNAYPYVSVDVDNDAGAAELLERFQLTAQDAPVIIGRGGQICRTPTVHGLAEFLQMNPAIDNSRVHDLLIVGAGPAGLAAAVYAASEGLDVIVIDSFAPGGQAGSSSRIENYLGFPTGISGMALAGRALVQSQKFGARFYVACDALTLRCDERPYSIELSDGCCARATSVIIATGAQYRTLELENLARFTGVGIYYAATHLEAMLCQGEEIVIVGGGNSAGQAAVFLASECRHVHILVRSEGLAESMSSYLIRRITDSPNITLHTHSQIVELRGEAMLKGVTWYDHRSGERQSHDIGHVFLMTGAAPNTRWLQECVYLDDKKFVRTGADLTSEELAAAGWPLSRPPHLFETSLPGVFAVGDVRSGSIKRIASGVGEGSICVQLVHKVVRELSTLPPQLQPAQAVAG